MASTALFSRIFAISPFPLVFSFWEISFTCTDLPITLKCTPGLHFHLVQIMASRYFKAFPFKDCSVLLDIFLKHTQCLVTSNVLSNCKQHVFYHPSNSHPFSPLLSQYPVNPNPLLEILLLLCFHSSLLALCYSCSSYKL